MEEERTDFSVWPGTAGQNLKGTVLVEVHANNLNAPVRKRIHVTLEVREENTLAAAHLRIDEAAARAQGG